MLLVPIIADMQADSLLSLLGARLTMGIPCLLNRDNSDDEKSPSGPTIIIISSISTKFVSTEKKFSGKVF